MPMARRGRRRTRPSRSALALRWIGALVLVGIAVAYVHPLREWRGGGGGGGGGQARGGPSAGARKAGGAPLRHDRDRRVEEEARAPGLRKVGDTMIGWTTKRWSPGSSDVLPGPSGGRRFAARTAFLRLRNRLRSGPTASPFRRPTT